MITSTRSRNQPSNSNKELTTPAFDSTSLSRPYLLHRHAVKHCYGIVRVDAGTLLFSQTQVEVSFKLFCFVLVNSHSVFNRESMCSQTLCSISTPLFLLSPPSMLQSSSAAFQRRLLCQPLLTAAIHGAPLPSPPGRRAAKVFYFTSYCFYKVSVDTEGFTSVKGTFNYSHLQILDSKQVWMAE